MNSFSKSLTEDIDEIKVGTKITEYFYSDRNVYEVIEVKSQKDVIVREMKAVTKVAYSNDWELFSDENGRVKELVFRYGSWYEKYTNVWTNKVEYEKGKYIFGRADYYFDYEF